MAATEEEATEAAPPKKPRGTTTSTRGSSKVEEAPQEELGGVIRTSRIGPIKWRGISSGSTPDEMADRRHAKLEEAKKPGDEGYNAFKDPMVPTSSLAQIITTELAGEESEGSPTWDALNEAYQASHEELEAMRSFRAGRRSA